MSAIADWNRIPSGQHVQRRQGSPLLYLLGFVSALFIGILIFCYVVTRHTNPVFLDEHGKPTQSSGYSHH